MIYGKREKKMIFNQLGSIKINWENNRWLFFNFSQSSRNNITWLIDK